MVCIAGAMVLTLYKGLLLAGADHTTDDKDRATRSNNTDGWAIGSLFLTAACTLWSGWFLLQARIGTSFPFKYSSTAIMSFFASIQSVILTLILERDSSKWIVKGKLDIFCILYAVRILFNLQHFCHYSPTLSNWLPIFRCKGDRRTRRVLRGDGLVCEEERSSVHISIYTSYPDFCRSVWFLFSPWPHIPWKVLSLPIISSNFSTSYI